MRLDVWGLNILSATGDELGCFVVHGNWAFPRCRSERVRLDRLGCWSSRGMPVSWTSRQRRLGVAVLWKTLAKGKCYERVRAALPPRLEAASGGRMERP